MVVVIFVAGGAGTFVVVERNAIVVMDDDVAFHLRFGQMRVCLLHCTREP